ncbi:Phosphoacetylglucosamine mutase [Carpediemonas membranifera]|uniref:Phosphoacetylglucosamine mutase n=1 Tax=Carpediemonas membranifera TaxID=201153 RepID=A0A8J6E3C6_9EUKA|nr:Phosphoacetylglucosamine mutase [Carpediemonas membranifera]|eukprot:KAG9395753.1 Phosphoacetylglucosamine mutase [Carpediemonas membranifera]
MSEEYPLMLTISGIRGIAGKSLTAAVVERYVEAFGAFIHAHHRAGSKRIIVCGRDSRVSGLEINTAACELLTAQGWTVWDIGIVPTPTVQYMVKKHALAGGIVITSSHNPKQWNGLKFVGPDSLFLSPDACAEVFKDDAPRSVGTEHEGHLVLVGDAAEQHVNDLLQLPIIPVEDIESRRFTVALDTVCGAGGPIMAYLLEQLGATVRGQNLETSGLFPRDPEPTVGSLAEFCKFVEQSDADLGIAVDPDVDRCVLIDERGVCFGEEFTLAIAVDYILSHVGRKGCVVKNLSSSMMTDVFAARNGCELVEAAVGEINVALAMREMSAVIGGEGNGGVMLPDLHIGRDAPVAAALALAWLAVGGGTMSERIGAMPHFAIVKHKVPLGGLDPDAVLERARTVEIFPGQRRPEVSTLDGVKLKGGSWWVHVRKSNTEPILRVIAEARSKEEAEDLCDRVKKALFSE